MDGWRELALLMMMGAPATTSAGLPPVPVPAENPITEEKRALGKILFWDEQLSSDNTVACGTCHKPGLAGTDARTGIHPGSDNAVGSDDDVLGSPGIRKLDKNGLPVKDSIYKDGPQVTNRTSPSYFGHLWAESLFWDGRAGPVFDDPLTGVPVIKRGGALESQALKPIMNTVEMAREGRDWRDVVIRLEQAKPLALADRIPADISRNVARVSNYSSLFSEAFGDPGITPVRIAMAIATYERTLVADQTPWDEFDAGTLEAPVWRTGLATFKKRRCDQCHTPPLFTSNDFKNIGLRPAFEDQGRARISGQKKDMGDMKVPSLRNVALRKHFMHTGTLDTLDDVLELYAAPKAPPDTLPNGEPYAFRMDELERASLKDFLLTALTDPRVASESFPFDRPRLRSERNPEDTLPPGSPGRLVAARNGGAVHLTWAVPTDNKGVVDYVLQRNGRVIALPTTPGFVDRDAHWAALHFYRVVARDDPGNRSASATILVWPAWGPWTMPLVVVVVGAVLFRYRRRT